MKDESKDWVFMLHGFLGTPVEMLPLCRWLRPQGFRVSVWGHATLNRSVAGHADKFCSYVRKSAKNHPYHPPRMHFVGHSMGAIILRAAMPLIAAETDLPPLGRAVMLAPPNGGTPLASMMPRWLRCAFPAIEDLSDSPDSMVSSLPRRLPIEFGILRVKNDHLVSCESSVLQSALEIADVEGLHTTMLYRRSLAIKISNFLKVGRFDP